MLTIEMPQKRNHVMSIFDIQNRIVTEAYCPTEGSIPSSDQ
jgi:hypothetical protein